MEIIKEYVINKKKELAKIAKVNYKEYGLEKLSTFVYKKV